MTLNVELVGETDMRSNSISGSMEIIKMHSEVHGVQSGKNRMKYKYLGKNNSED